MDTKDRLEDEDDGVWRAVLPRWTAPSAPVRLEDRLRRQFRARRHAAAFLLWAGRVAMVALALAATMMSRTAGPGRVARLTDASAIPVAVAAADLDLSGFEPVRRLRLGRLGEVVTETVLDGFVPVGKMTLTRGEGRP
jgi:hypothetical protein